MKTDRITSLDSLRGIACIVVLFAHIISTNSNIGIYANGCGKIGVWCFMVLSGFLTFLPYAQGKEIPIEDKWSYVLTYYKAKIKKLYPAYLIALLLGFVLGFFEDIKSVILHLLCLEGVGHFWYMPVIIKFYAIAPLLILLLGYIGKKFIILVCGLILFFNVAFPFTAYVENSICLYWYISVFLTGCLLAFLYVKIKNKGYKIINILSLISVFVIILLTPKMREIIWNIEPSKWLQNKYLVFAVLWSVLILGILKNKKASNILQNSRLLQFIGKISFEIYLIHYLLLKKVVRYIHDTTLVGLVVIVMSIIIGVLINYAFNKKLCLNKASPMKGIVFKNTWKRKG